MAGPKSAVAGVILAAGLSSRFGGEKLITRLAGRPLGAWAVRAAMASRLGRVVLVARPDMAEVLSAFYPGLELVLNPQASAGQALSLRLGLEALGPEYSHALFLLADQPLISPGLIDRFIREAETGRGLAALAGLESFSPPTLFAHQYWDALARLEGDAGGRDLLRAQASQAAFIPPSFPLAGLDVDRPQQLGRAEAVLAQRFSQALRLEKDDLVSLVGAGGKTALLEALASEQAADGQAVLATTTTHIHRPLGRVLLEPQEERLPGRVEERLAPGWCLTVAHSEMAGEGHPKLKGLLPSQVDWLCQEGVAPLILVEADGARRLPLKAPRAHEPSLPSSTTLLVGVLGLAGVGQPVDEEHVLGAAEFCALTGAGPGQAATPAQLTALALDPKGLFKKAPARARKVLVLNQADLAGAVEAGREVATLLAGQDPSLRVLLTSVQMGSCEVLNEGS